MRRGWMAVEGVEIGGWCRLMGGRRMLVAGLLSFRLSVLSVRGRGRKGREGRRAIGFIYTAVLSGPCSSAMGWFAETRALRQEGTRHPPPCQRQPQPTNAPLSKQRLSSDRKKKKRLLRTAVTWTEWQTTAVVLAPASLLTASRSCSSAVAEVGGQGVSFAVVGCRD